MWMRHGFRGLSRVHEFHVRFFWTSLLAGEVYGMCKDDRSAFGAGGNPCQPQRPSKKTKSLCSCPWEIHRKRRKWPLVFVWKMPTRSGTMLWATWGVYSAVHLASSSNWVYISPMIWVSTFAKGPKSSSVVAWWQATHLVVAKEGNHRCQLWANSRVDMLPHIRVINIMTGPLKQ